MAIAPNSEVRLLSGVPLTSDGLNTYYWSSLSGQTDAMKLKTVYTIDKATYIRKSNEEFLSVPYSKDQLEGVVNYVMYKNTSYKDKWFYAFIREIRYVNDNVSHIIIEEDSVMTWFFEMHLRSVFIERQHSVTDDAGDNRVEEPMTGAPAYDAVTDVAVGFGDSPLHQDALNVYDIVFTASDTPTQVRSGDREETRWRRAYTDLLDDEKILIVDKGFRDLTSRVYSGLYYVHIPLPAQGETIDGRIYTPQDLLERYTSTLINAYVEDNKVNGIVSGFMFPVYFRNNSSGSWVYTQTERMAGYTPFNKKLYTYPFNYGQVWVMSGNFRDVHFEEFSDNHVHLECICDDSPAPLPFIYPLNYSGLARDYASGIYLQPLPQIAWTSDQYLAWFANMGAEQSINAGLNLIGAGFSSAGAIAGGNILGAVTGLLSPVTQLIATEAHKKNIQSMPDVLHGNQSASLTNDKGLNTFRFKHLSVRADYARIIDDYFTMFGYAQKIIAVPNIHARSRYTYIKTAGDPAYGNIPTYALDRINSLFNAGITFWADRTHFMEYNMGVYPNNTL